MPASGKRLPWLWAQHMAGRSRLGLCPVRADNTCRWAAIDLDAHGDDDGDRLLEAQLVAGALAELHLSPYIARSRGGKGYHVLVFFAEPGVAVGELRRLLVPFAAEVKPGDVFPTGRRMIFLPGLGGAPLLDRDLDLVGPEQVEPDDPALVLAAIGPPKKRDPRAWPPAYWSPTAGGGSGGRLPRELEDVRQLIFTGTDGLWRARAGARNRIAGLVARRLLRSGGGFAAFERWDRGNLPPLATDEPAALATWWRWAEGKEARPSRRRPEGR